MKEFSDVLSSKTDKWAIRDTRPTVEKPDQHL